MGKLSGLSPSRMLLCNVSFPLMGAGQWSGKAANTAKNSAVRRLSTAMAEVKREEAAEEAARAGDVSEGAEELMRPRACRISSEQ